jgi:ADP-ribosylglycohydrolase
MQIFAKDVPTPENLANVVEEALRRLPSIKSEDDGNKTYGELWADEISRLNAVVRLAIQLTTSDLPNNVAIEMIGGGWTGHEALAIAIYSSIKHFGNFENAIVNSVNHSGDSDSTGSICGNIMGALVGRKAIPDHYTDTLEILDVIEEIGEDLYTGCIVGDYRPNDKPKELRWIDKYCHYKRSPKK